MFQEHFLKHKFVNASNELQKKISGKYPMTSLKERARWNKRKNIPIGGQDCVSSFLGPFGDMGFKPEYPWFDAH